jgi:hypothetical protein
MVSADEFGNFLGHILALGTDHFRAEVFCEGQILRQATLVLRTFIRPNIDVDHKEFSFDALRHSPRSRNQVLRCMAGTNAGNLKINEIGPQLIAEFASERQRDGLQISSINSCLRALRRLLRLAVEWGVVESCPKVKLLSG